MSTFVTGGDDAFRLMAFGVPNQQTVDYIQNQYTQLRSVVGEAGQAFLNSAYTVFNAYGGENAIRLAKATLRKADHFFQPNTIRRLETMSDWQQASPEMQRYIMSCPEIRKMLHQNRIDGYSETYVDNAPGVIGDKHLDYQRVVNGVMQMLPEDNEFDADTKIVVYMNEDPEPMEFQQQRDILSTWDLIKMHLYPGGEDPTSTWANKM